MRMIHFPGTNSDVCSFEYNNYTMFPQVKTKNNPVYIHIICKHLI